MSATAHDEMQSTDFRKYAKPIRRFSRKLGRNLSSKKSAEVEGRTTDGDSHIRLLGGSGGIAALELGNVNRSFVRRSSNSEYLLALSMSIHTGSCVEDRPFSNYY